mmetsp:Transcript_25255/g.59867  ORF Transcript_25255/g.59867 Transcript_25255/m.59867 type:complete len:116 (-) Transcript_25255:44-391(-)
MDKPEGRRRSEEEALYFYQSKLSYPSDGRMLGRKLTTNKNKNTRGSPKSTSKVKEQVEKCSFEKKFGFGFVLFLFFELFDIEGKVARACRIVSLSCFLFLSPNLVGTVLHHTVVT